MATKKNKVSKALAKAKKITAPKTSKRKASVERYLNQGQNHPQSKAWTEGGDEGLKAKPIGYRWTTLGAEKLGKNPMVKPSTDDVEKYRTKTFRAKGESHRYLYTEKRVDKSDKNKNVRFADGGDILAEDTIARVEDGNLADASAYKKGGGVKEIHYAEVYPILKDKIDNVIDDIPYENANGGKGEEVEHQSRSGFFAYTDGGYQYDWFEYVSIMNGSGQNLPTKPLDAELDRQVKYNYDIAKETFSERHPEIVKELGEDKINYHDLYEEGYESEAEELSELEMDYGGEDSILMRVFAYYYTPENSRAENGKHTISLFGDVNLESPYHRAGNLDDSIEITFTFNSIADLSKKMDANLKKIVGWFNGDRYNKSKKEMKIRRMADGGMMAKGGVAGKRKASVERYLGQGQNHPQSKAWTEVGDEGLKAKPIGYRWTTLGAEKLGKNPSVKPSTDDVEKYRTKTFRVARKPNPNSEDGSYRYLYTEKRVDKSDRNKNLRFADGGDTDDYARGGKTTYRPQYIANDEIESITLKSGKVIKNDSIYDGAYVSKSLKLAKGGYSQGYDDREDERLGMSHGKMSGKDFVGSHRQREHSRRDDAGFEERMDGGMMAKGGVAGKRKASVERYLGQGQNHPQSYAWKESADEQERAKPIGYRFTDKLANRLGVNPTKRPSAEQIEKYSGRGIYWENRVDKSDKNPARKFMYGGYAKGGVQRIANIESRTYSENMIPFKGNNLEGKTLDNGDYVVLSYGYYPIWWYCKKEGKWYGNSTKYSVTTSKQMSQSRPSYDATMVTKSELDKLMMSHHASFEYGGSIDDIIGDATNNPQFDIDAPDFQGSI